MNLMKKNIMVVCGRVETKLISSKVSFMHKFRLRNWKILTNVGAANNARILVFWSPSTINVDFILIFLLKVFMLA